MLQHPKIVIIGGGTGSFTLLHALKDHSDELTALVNMADDGGSTGVLRDELGVLPPGDIRQCLVALSDASLELRQLFNYRFAEGTFGGHSFGNLFLSAVEKMTDNFNDAVRIAGDVLQIRGRVIPVTLTNCQLVMLLDGQKVNGQYAIETTSIPVGLRPEMSLSPATTLNPDARQAIQAADLVVIAPGNLYASLAPALLVDGLADALRLAKAPLVYIANLVNKAHHTADFSVDEYAAEIERFLGGTQLDYVVYNIDQPDAEQLQKYALENEFPVRIDQPALAKAHYEATGAKLLSHAEVARDSNDRFIERSLIRHDGEALATAIMQLLQL